MSGRQKNGVAGEIYRFGLSTRLRFEWTEGKATSCCQTPVSTGQKEELYERFHVYVRTRSFLEKTAGLDRVVN